ncbi:hypothetical protein OG563_26740 [Nocardia vinacea]|uniref:Uncharacterized protein n=1 Tax=Nocardia vinacea TaxID=96468 RepID=A0ABZ1YM46_9NOCA|nr:hypothetical protein [Nocardia vinacea]
MRYELRHVDDRMLVCVEGKPVGMVFTLTPGFFLSADHRGSFAIGDDLEEAIEDLTNAAPQRE